jgi:serine/threonine protein kinase/Tol biopolymer transport system component
MSAPDRWSRVEALYHAARERAAGERAAFLDIACRGDIQLRRDVESLLAQPASRSGFLSQPAVAIAAQMMNPGARLTGRRIGVYELEALIGAGGMGEVYRARDTKLGRDVAIKILPSEFTSHPDRLTRFQREARVLASLNHPHIGAIYGIEDGPCEAGPHVHALVLELVEGQTLADRIARGAVPIAEALAIARQIADALDAAHEKRIVHRDLKPANIKLTPDGVVKVLDFGIAKAAGGDGSMSDLTQSPTLTVGGTGEGVILGTAAYMSPEQARGREVDKRGDIWAFGCVLYEMLTGRAAFARDTFTDTLAAIIEREPDWTLLPATTPAGVRRVLLRCLEKDSKRRLRDIADVRFELDEPLSAPRRAGLGERAEPSPPVPASRWIYGVGIGLLVLGAALGWWLHARPSIVQTGAKRFDLSPPAGTDFVAGFGAVSPDGRFLTFVARSPTGDRLWVRALDSQAAQELPGTDGAAFPFWSPDSKSLGFFASGKLWRIDIAGGTPTQICDVPAGRGGTWNANGVIIYNAVNDGPLLQVPATGGAPRALTTLDVTRHENSHRYPTFLPDGRHFLYFIRSDDREIQGIYVGSIERPQDRTRVIPSDFNGVYSPGLDQRSGHLLWLRNGALVAQPFDVERFSVSGEAVTVADSNPIVGGPNALSPVSVSRDGTLVYGSSPEPHHQLTWYARDGKPVGTVGPPDAYLDLRISPDGQKVAVLRVDASTSRTNNNTSDIWLMDIGRGVPNRVTFDGANLSSLAWSPDGNRVAYPKADSPPNLFVQDVTKAGSTERLVSSHNTQTFPDWSPDGRLLLYSEAVNDPSSTTRTDLRLLSLDGARTITPYLQTSFAETHGRFSPDGKWVAYTSDESGQNDVYVQSIPVGGSKVRISSKGGDFARWRHDGKELFYAAPDTMLMAVAVRTLENSLTFDEPKPLFKIAGRAGTFDIPPDGQRILALPPVDDDAAPSMTVVVNWPTLAKK